MKNEAQLHQFFICTEVTGYLYTALTLPIENEATKFYILLKIFLMGDFQQGFLSRTIFQRHCPAV
jgi:hypothetical protein